MKYDPSMYIGIGKDGFLPPDDVGPEHDFSWVGSNELARGSGGLASRIAFFTIFGGVMALLGYFFSSF